MDNDRIKGAAKEVKGAIKETAGKLTGNRQTEIEGKAEKAVGKVQRNVGEAKDKVRDAGQEVGRTARQPVLVLRTDRSSPIMKHYRNAALGLALALGAALAPVHAQRHHHVPGPDRRALRRRQKQCDARSGDSGSLPETGARRQGRGRGAGQGRQAEGRGQPRRGQGAPGRGLRRGQEECAAMSGDAKDACLAEAKTRYGK